MEPAGRDRGHGCAPTAWAQAFELQGEKALIAQTRDGASTRIGSVFFEPAAQAGRTAFRVKMDHTVLRDYFLSMREFKCLPAEAEVSCFVPYPYAQPGTIAPDDLGWLEHSLLFLYKQPRDFGAKLWNGMIFKLTPTDKGLCRPTPGRGPQPHQCAAGRLERFALWPI